MTEIQVDPAFARINIKQASLLIWRIEKMQVRALNIDDYGKFYTGDSYIVYHATGSTRGPIQVDIHFWLGGKTSMDEAAVAAYKTVELDNLLGGSPVQHREVEGRESAKFKSYFREGIMYLEGGVDSGMQHVDTRFQPKMYWVKGKRHPVIRQLSCVSWHHINDGDVFVIDTRENIFIWTGRYANNMEKIQGARLGQKLRNEHGGGDIVIVESGDENTLHHSDRDLFDKVLPLNERTVLPAEDDTEDERQDQRTAREITLYRCCDESGSVELTKEKNGPLLQTDLSSQDSFIIDNGNHGIWVWIGKLATKKERSEGMRIAQNFIQQKCYPEHTPITRVIDGGEPNEFKSLFRSWQDKDASTGMGLQSSVGHVAKTKEEAFDSALLHSNTESSETKLHMPDDGQSNKQVWRVEKFKLVSLEHKDYGSFYAGDCYLVMYTYRVRGREEIIIYFWLGSQSSADEQGTAALKAREMDDEHGGTPVQVRVVQGKEPPHFIAMFGGLITIYSGGVASSFDGANAHDVQVGDTYMLQVRSTSDNLTRAIQVQLQASSLNSNDCFVIKVKSTVYLWLGQGSMEEEQKSAAGIAAKTGTKTITIKEGEEIESFWQDIGGKEEYSSDERLKEEKLRPARLFQCSNASGCFRVEEIFHFDQSDLIEDDVMLLDAGRAIFIWIGSKSNKEERNKSERVAIDYLTTDPAGRDLDTPVLKIKQHYEPVNFTGYFGVWSTSFWSDQPSWSSIKQEVAALKQASIERVDKKSSKSTATYSLKQLTEMTHPPDHIDPCKKELFLNDQEFHKTFQMSKDDFSRLPQWKQNSKKKEVGLF